MNFINIVHSLHALIFIVFVCVSLGCFLLSITAYLVAENFNFINKNDSTYWSFISPDIEQPT